MKIVKFNTWEHSGHYRKSHTFGLSGRREKRVCHLRLSDVTRQVTRDAVSLTNQHFLRSIASLNVAGYKETVTFFIIGRYVLSRVWETLHRKLWVVLTGGHSWVPCCWARADNELQQRFRYVHCTPPGSEFFWEDELWLVLSMRRKNHSQICRLVNTSYCL